MKKHQTTTWRIASVVAALALVVGVTTSASASSSTTQTQAAANQVDAQFVRMMIPHHFQALVMSEMAPSRTNNETLLALAERIDVEQDLEIYMMQSWQRWNGLEVTDAEQAYQQVLQDPALLEQMGMATPAEIDELRASTGTAFDTLYLELMIPHHEGAITMLVNVIINGSDFILEQWANDMMVTQWTQILQMEAMLADLA